MSFDNRSIHWLAWRISSDSWTRVWQTGHWASEVFDSLEEAGVMKSAKSSSWSASDGMGWLARAGLKKKSVSVP